MVSFEHPRRMAVAAAVVAALVSGGGLVYAQEGSVSGLTVIAPRQIGRDAATGAAIERVSMQADIHYSDLDLKSAKGAAEFEKRVRESAKAMCEELEKNYPVGTPDSITCTNEAVRKVESRVKALEGGG